MFDLYRRCAVTGRVSSRVHILPMNKCNHYVVGLLCKYKYNYYNKIFINLISDQKCVGILKILVKYGSNSILYIICKYIYTT